MRRYMVAVDLPHPMPTDFILTIPLQRKWVDRMLGKGELVQYILNEDRTHLWMVLLAEDDEQLHSLLRRMPIAHFCEYQAHALFLHQQAMDVLPPVMEN